MKLVICSVYDSAMAAYQRPFCVPTVGMAVRSFGDACKTDVALKGHLEDYALFRLGEFDEESGKCSNLDAPEQIARGLDYKEIT